MDRGYPHNFKENLLSQIKLKERKSALLKQNNKEEKDTIPASALSVFYKRSFNEKVESHTKPTTTLPNF